MSIGKFRKQPWFEAVYKVGVGIKGLDGFLELAYIRNLDPSSKEYKEWRKKQGLK
jgi:hypothetical protein